MIADLSHLAPQAIEAGWSPQGDRIHTILADGTVRIWDAGGQLLFTLPQADVSADFCIFSPFGRYILTGSRQSLRLWSSTGELLEERAVNADFWWEAQFAPDEKSIVVRSVGEPVQLWRLDSAGHHTLLGHDDWDDWDLAVTYSPAGRFLLTGSTDHKARLWDLQGDLMTPLLLDRHQDQVLFVTFSPDGRYILTGSKDQSAKLWDTRGNLLADLPDQEGAVIWGAISADNRFIFTLTEQGRVRIWPLPAVYLEQLDKLELAPLSAGKRQRYGLEGG
jgi:WD40 repeat protein